MDKPSMFEQSRSLVAGAKIIIDSEGINDDGEIKKPTTPVILSCAFAIEFLLKLLILQETGNSANGHNLDALYNRAHSRFPGHAAKSERWEFAICFNRLHRPAL